MYKLLCKLPSFCSHRLQSWMIWLHIWVAANTGEEVMLRGWMMEHGDSWLRVCEHLSRSEKGVQGTKPCWGAEK